MSIFPNFHNIFDLQTSMSGQLKIAWQGISTLATATSKQISLVQTALWVIHLTAMALSQKTISHYMVKRKCKYTELKCLRPLCTDEVFLVLSRGIIFSQIENYIYCHVTLKIPKSVKVFDPSFLTFTLAFNPNGSFTFERYLYTEVKKLNVFGNNSSPMGKVLENILWSIEPVSWNL